mgnify:CR=1 FL=1
MRNPGHYLLAPWQWVRRSFQLKLILSLFATAYFTLFVMGTFYYYKISGDIERNTIANLQRLTDQTATILENHMENIRNVAWSYFSDSDLQVFMDNFTTAYLDKSTYYRNRLVESMRQNGAIGMIGIYDLSGQGLEVGNRGPINAETRSLFERQQRLLLEQALRQDGYPLWLVTDAMAESSVGSKRTIGFVQALKKISTYSQRTVGMIYIEMNESLSKRLMTDINAAAEDGFLIVDKQGKVVFAEDDRQIGEEIGHEQWFQAMMLQDEDGYLEMTIHGKPFIVLHRELNRAGWKLVGQIPLATVLREVTQARDFTLGIGFISLTVATVLLYFIASSVTRPIRKLREYMKQVELGNFKVAIPVKSYDEIGTLSRSFNRMTREIDHLVEKVYESELLKKEAELVALQSQINPHFLYNALGAIDSLAAIGGQEQISRISQSLTSMFRYNIKGGQTATLRDEIHQVELYLTVQQIRFGDRFRYEIGIEPGLELQTIPKLVLQPIVENAVKHGVERQRAEGMISVTACSLPDGRFRIRVADNGAGCDEELVQTLNQMLSGSDQTAWKTGEGRSSIGLDNVNRRIRLHYGEGARMTISSVIGTGTTVTLLLPFKTGLGRNTG